MLAGLSAPTIDIDPPGNRIEKMATNSTNGANLGFEGELWKMADGLRSNMDAAEYKHVVLGLIFLKYISDAFEEQHAKLDADRQSGADPEDPDEYRAVNIFWVPPEARWSNLEGQRQAAQRSARSSMTPCSPSSATTLAQGRAAQGLRPPAARQAAPRAAHRPGRQHRLGQHRRTAPRTSWAGFTSTSSPSSPAPKERRAASSTRPAAWSACWSRCSPRTRAGCTTRAAVRAACSSSRRSSSRPTAATYRRHQHLRPGVQPHHVAIGQDEPGHSRHRQQPGQGTRRQLPPRPAPGPQGRLRAGQSAVQRQRLARRTAEGRQTLEVRHAARRATPTSPGSSTSSTTSPQRAWPASCWPTAPCRRTSRARAISARPSSRPTWWTAWSPCRASSSTARRFPSACGSSPATRRTAGSVTAAGHVLFIDARKLGTLIDRVHRELIGRRHSEDRRHVSRLARRQPVPSPSGRGQGEGGSTKTSPASARAPRSTTSASTATSSRPAATSARPRSRTTASRSRTRWPV